MIVTGVTSKVLETFESFRICFSLRMYFPQNLVVSCFFHYRLLGVLPGPCDSCHGELREPEILNGLKKMKILWILFLENPTRLFYKDPLNLTSSNDFSLQRTFDTISLLHCEL